MYKVAAMGDWDSIYGFGALGLDTFAETGDNPDQASRLIRKLGNDNYAVIFVTEALAAKIPDVIEEFRSLPNPAVILIPGISGNTGEGISAVKRSVEQAVGSDIIFGNK